MTEEPTRKSTYAGLSYGARGLYITLLSAPRSLKSKMNMTTLMEYAGAPNGRESTYNLLHELMDAGYVAKVEKRTQGKIASVTYRALKSPCTPDRQ